MLHILKLCGFITLKRLNYTTLKDIYQYLFSSFFSLGCRWIVRPVRYELSSPQSSSTTSMSRPSRVPLTDGCKSFQRAVKMEMVPAVWNGTRRTWNLFQISSQRYGWHRLWRRTQVKSQRLAMPTPPPHLNFPLNILFKIHGLSYLFLETIIVIAQSLPKQLQKLD